MNIMNNDVFEEVFETGGLKRVLFHETGSFAISPKSTQVTLYVYIDADTDKNSYILEFSHLEKDSFLATECIDRTEKFDKLFNAAVERQQKAKAEEMNYGKEPKMGDVIKDDDFADIDKE